MEASLLHVSCTKLTTVQELHTSESAHSHAELPSLLLFGRNGEEALPRCLGLHWLNQSHPLACVHIAVLPLALEMYLFSRFRSEKLLVAKYNIIFDMN